VAISPLASLPIKAWTHTFALELFQDVPPLFLPSYEIRVL
jgi:hypothetical protein